MLFLEQACESRFCAFFWSCFWWHHIEISYGGSIYIMEIGKYYKSTAMSLLPSSQRLNIYQHSSVSKEPSQPQVGYTVQRTAMWVRGGQKCFGIFYPPSKMLVVWPIEYNRSTILLFSDPPLKMTGNFYFLLLVSHQRSCRERSLVRISQLITISWPSLWGKPGCR